MRVFIIAVVFIACGCKGNPQNTYAQPIYVQPVNDAYGRPFTWATPPPPITPVAVPPPPYKR